MATFKFYIPAINLMGAGCLQEAAADIKGYGYRKALIVTDKILNQIGVVAKLTTLLAEHGIESVVFDETKPNPTMTNVESGTHYLAGGTPVHNRLVMMPGTDGAWSWRVDSSEDRGATWQIVTRIDFLQRDRR